MFENTPADIYENDSGDMFMTTKQLADCLGYASKNGVESMLNRNPYLKESEFSMVLTIRNPLDKSEKGQETRVFTEDGIYEVSMLANTDKAKDFRCWIRRILKSLRRNETILVNRQEIMAWQTQIVNLNEKVNKLEELSVCEPDNKKLNIWKNTAGYPKVNTLVSITGMEFGDVLNMIYDKMTDKVGFVAYSALMDYKVKYHLDNIPYTIDAVADSPTYQRDFVICANELIREFKRKNTASEPTPTPLDKFDAAVRPLIELRGDKSARGAMTLKEVYKKMHTKQSWAVMRGRNKCNSNKQLIMKKDSEYDLFCKTVNEMIGEFE